VCLLVERNLVELLVLDGLRFARQRRRLLDIHNNIVVVVVVVVVVARAVGCGGVVGRRRDVATGQRLFGCLGCLSIGDLRHYI
jgi:hypothetical protein